MFKKNKILVLVIIFLSCCASSCLAKKQKQDLVPTKSFVKIHKSFKILECKEKSKVCKPNTFVSTGSGSSVFIHKDFNFVLTAGHLCPDEVSGLPHRDEVKTSKSFILVQDYRNTFHEAEIVYFFEGNIKKGEADLCLLHVPTLDIPKIDFSKRMPVPGERVVSMSAPGGIYHPPTVPIFEGRYSGKINEVASIATVASKPGSSGGPVLNSKNEIIGVIFAVSLYTSNVTLITEYNKTKEFLKVAKDGFRKAEQGN